MTTHFSGCNCNSCQAADLEYEQTEWRRIREEEQKPAWHEESAAYKPPARVSDDYETFDTYERYPYERERLESWYRP